MSCFHQECLLLQALAALRAHGAAMESGLPQQSMQAEMAAFLVCPSTICDLRVLVLHVLCDAACFLRLLNGTDATLRMQQSFIHLSIFPLGGLLSFVPVVSLNPCLYITDLQKFFRVSSGCSRLRTLHLTHGNIELQVRASFQYHLKPEWTAYTTLLTQTCYCRLFLSVALCVL